jgi:hypothetical protein
MTQSKEIFITQSRKDTKIRKLDNLLLCAFAPLRDNFYTLDKDGFT